ncbi:hypothetical protein E2C01_070494 [Portunus trituberculatus]|uniref:Uncharacterized protein n=1 Tax=Portunus trituberculatus TaxID=210409 RepID=A0A5B7HUA4_PORTR|nr:hypothetical protein [Portunus trituberculatus]
MTFFLPLETQHLTQTKM